MTATEYNPSLHHHLMFNNVKTNLGSAYNSNSGMFTAPTDGVYVFSWTIFSYYNSFVYTQIVVNSNAYDSMITDSEHVADVHSGTKLIIVSLNRGDVVYVRTHDTIHTHGHILSDDHHGQATLCGWKLM